MFTSATLTDLARYPSNVFTSATLTDLAWYPSTPRVHTSNTYWLGLISQYTTCSHQQHLLTWPDIPVHHVFTPATLTDLAWYPSTPRVHISNTYWLGLISQYTTCSHQQHLLTWPDIPVHHVFTSATLTDLAWYPSNVFTPATLTDLTWYPSNVFTPATLTDLAWYPSTPRVHISNTYWLGLISQYTTCSHQQHLLTWPGIPVRVHTSNTYWLGLISQYTTCSHQQHLLTWSDIPVHHVFTPATLTDLTWYPSTPRVHISNTYWLDLISQYTTCSHQQHLLTWPDIPVTCSHQQHLLTWPDIPVHHVFTSATLTDLAWYPSNVFTSATLTDLAWYPSTPRVHTSNTYWLGLISQ